MTLAKRTSSASGIPLPGSGGAIPSRAESADAQAEFDAPMPSRVLARGRRPGRRRGARHAAAGRGVLADGGLLRPHAGHAPRLQQRVHEHAARREERRVPAGDQEHARVRPADPQALRQLHEQSRRADGGRPVRGRRQVLRRGHADGDDARPADVRPRPDRGLRRALRHGVPPRVRRRDARPELIARHEREIFPLLHQRSRFAEVDDFALYDFAATTAGVNEDVFAFSNTRDGDRDRWSSTTTDLRRRGPSRSAGIIAQRGR